MSGIVRFAAISGRLQRSGSESVECSPPASCREPFYRLREIIARICRVSNFPACSPASIDRVGSIGSGAEDKIETRSFGERPEVAVSCEEANTPVDTALGNQRVS
jgi:hypothetical protein